MTEVIKVEDCGENIGDYDVQIYNAVLVPENATNGDIIKAMFPFTESRLDEKTGITLVKWEDGTTKCFKTDWWNAPYKGVRS